MNYLPNNEPINEENTSPLTLFVTACLAMSLTPEPDSDGGGGTSPWRNNRGRRSAVVSPR